MLLLGTASALMGIARFHLNEMAKQSKEALGRAHFGREWNTEVNITAIEGRVPAFAYRM